MPGPSSSPVSRRLPNRRQECQARFVSGAAQEKAALAQLEAGDASAQRQELLGQTIQIVGIQRIKQAKAPAREISGSQHEHDFFNARHKDINQGQAASQNGSPIGASAR